MYLFIFLSRNSLIFPSLQEVVFVRSLRASSRCRRHVPPSRTTVFPSSVLWRCCCRSTTCAPCLCRCPTSARPPAKTRAPRTTATQRAQTKRTLQPSPSKPPQLHESSPDTQASSHSPRNQGHEPDLPHFSTSTQVLFHLKQTCILLLHLKKSNVKRDANLKENCHFEIFHFFILSSFSAVFTNQWTLCQVLKEDLESCATDAAIHSFLILIYCSF